MLRRGPAVLCALAGLLALAGAADAQNVYQNDFESGSSGPGWTANVSLTPTTDTPVFTKFLGRYTSNQGVQLTVTPPANLSNNNGGGGSGGGTGTVPINYSLLFDFYAFDTWDGNGPNGPDHLQVTVNGVTLFDHAFTNTRSHPEWQTYPKAPDLGYQLLGGNPAELDSLYRNVQIDFSAAPGTTLIFKWKSQGLSTDLNDESWGIDNIRVNAVPAPGSLALLGVGGALAARRRRR